MKIVLINPPFLPGQQPRYRLPPLGLLYVATFLEKNGWEVLVYDGEARGATVKEIVDWVLDYKADVVGIYTMTLTVPVVSDIVDSLKIRLPDIYVVLGGPHVTATLDEMMKNNSHIDYLIYGEGEYPFFEFVSRLESGDNLREVKNLIYYNESNQIEINPKANYIENLDILPFPNLNLIHNISSIKYRVPYVHFAKITSIMTSRGCPYSCTFCSASLTHGKRVRIRSPENAIEEITSKYSIYKINYFVIKDSIFTIDREWTVNFCNQLERKRLNIRWRCNTRIDTVDKELLKLMKSAGCSCIGFGIESTDNRVLKNIKKDISLTQIEKVLRWTDRIELETHCTLMVGNPGETLESIKNTLYDIKRLKPDTIACSIATAYPGTKLYEESIQRGLLDNPHWYMNRETLSGDTFLDAPFRGGLNCGLDLEKLKKFIYFKFYFSRTYIFTILKRALKRPYLLMHVIKNIYPLMKLVKPRKKFL